MKLRSYRIVLEYTTADNAIDPPNKWDWFDLLAPDSRETVSLIKVDEISTPEAHIEDFKDRGVT